MITASRGKTRGWLSAVRDAAMKSKSVYMDRALRVSDPRYARILSKMGYQRSDMQAGATTGPEVRALRDEYERIFGKRAFRGWDAATLREKMAAHRSSLSAED